MYYLHLLTVLGALKGLHLADLALSLSAQVSACQFGAPEMFQVASVQLLASAWVKPCVLRSRRLGSATPPRGRAGAVLPRGNPHGLTAVGSISVQLQLLVIWPFPAQGPRCCRKPGEMMRFTIIDEIVGSHELGMTKRYGPSELLETDPS